jgi:hypothetical protein
MYPLLIKVLVAIVLFTVARAEASDSEEWPSPVLAAGAAKAAEPVQLLPVMEESNRDKSGTTPSQEKTDTSQEGKCQDLATCTWFQAERAGFEPAVRFDPHTAFPVLHLRPLGHLSERTREFYP